MSEQIKVTINEQEYEVDKGARLIDVCRENGHGVPSFCYYQDLAVQASCRMCLVRIDKMPKLQTSCTINCTDGMVATHGWQERTQMSAVRFVRILEQHGVKRVVYTDTSRDGMLGGPNLIGLRDLAEMTKLELVCSGGVALLDDLRRLARIGAPNIVGVIVGRALYEKAFTLADAMTAIGR